MCLNALAESLPPAAWWRDHFPIRDCAVLCDAPSDEARALAFVMRAGGVWAVYVTGKGAENPVAVRPDKEAAMYAATQLVCERCAP